MAETTVETTRQRSPNYPAISLEDAINRARQLDQNLGAHKASRATVLGHWSYAAKSSSGLQAVGALRAFGLLNVEGRGEKARYSLTERARRIIHEPDGSPRRRQALQEAAKSPEAYKILTEEYGMRLPPSDDAAVSFLVIDHQFTKSAAELLVGSYRSAVALAGLDSSLSENDNDDGEGERTAEIQAGDFVQWISQGSAQFRSPRRVMSVEEKDGDQFVMVTGARTAIPASEVKVIGGYTPPPLPETLAKGLDRLDLKQPGMKTEIASIGLSQASLSWPARLTQHEYEDLTYWLEGVLRKAQRDIDLGNTRSDAAVAYDEDDGE